MIENTKKIERIAWVDFAKVICITLVVLGHIPLEPSITKIIYAFHIPFFFFLSGLLDKNRTVKDQLKHDFKTLLVPYSLLYLIYYALWLPFIFPKHPELYGSGMTFENIVTKPLLGMLFGNGYHTAISTMICFPLWFLIALFVVKTIHSLLLNLCRGSNWLYFSAACLVVIAFLFINHDQIDLYFSVDSALLAFPFYAVGNRFSSFVLGKSHSGERLTRSFAGFLIGIFLLYILVQMSPLMGYTDIDHSLYGDSIGLFYLLGFLGITSMVCLLQWYVFKLRLITLISTGTIIIFTFHGWFFKVIFVGFGIRKVDIYQGGAVDLFTASWVSIATVVIMIPLIMAVKRYCPILMGGRK
jgi:acyltransferase